MVFFAAGIFAADRRESLPLGLYLSALAAAGAGIYAAWRWRDRLGLSTAAASAAFLVLGFCSFGPFAAAPPDLPLRRPAELRLRLREDAQAYGLRHQAAAEVVSGRVSGGTLPPRVLWRFYGAAIPPLGRGAQLQAAGWLTPLRNRANEQEPEQERRWARQGIYLVFKERGDRPPQMLAAGGRLLPRLRGAIRRSIASAGAGEGVLSALALGDQSGMDAATAERFRRCGASHLLSVSGLHFSVVFGIFFFIFYQLLRRSARLALRFDLRLMALLLALPFAWGYARLVYFSIPTWRSLLMLLFLTAVLAQRRRSDPLNYLLAAALGLLIWHPEFLFSVSFQLSAAAAAGLLLAQRKPLLPPLQNWPGQLLGKLFSLLILSLAAWLATLGLIAYHFGAVQLWAVPANLILVPWYSLIVMPLLMAGLLVSPLWNWLSGFLLAAAGRSVGFSLQFMDWIGRWPAAEIHPPHFTAAALVCTAALFLCLFCWPRCWRLWGAALAVAAGLILTFGYQAVQRMENRGGLAAHFLDVGQGEAVVLELPGGKTALLDGGGAYAGGSSEGERVVLPFLRRRGIDRLDLVIISHPDLDHIGGLAAVLSQLPAGRLVAACPYPGPAFAGLVQLAARRQVPLVLVGAGEIWDWPGLRLNFFHAPCEAPGPDNERSLGLRLEALGRRLLFLGDLGEKGLRHFPPGFFQAVDLFLIPHHGSRRAATLALLPLLPPPRRALISVGFANRFLFPHPAVLSALEVGDIPVLRTDLSGRISWSVSAAGQETLETARQTVKILDRTQLAVAVE